MTSPCLFVCQVCQLSGSERPDSPTTGEHLLAQLQALAAEAGSGLSIQGTGCLWSCHRPCTVTFVCPGKYTYHFVEVSPGADGADLLRFGGLYRASDNGYVLPAKLPAPLRPKLLVRIPPAPSNAMAAEPS